jgi:hypothetical protein
VACALQAVQEAFAVLGPRDDERRFAVREARANVLEHRIDEELAVLVDLHHVVARTRVADELRPVERRVHLDFR